MVKFINKIKDFKKDKVYVQKDHDYERVILCTKEHAVSPEFIILDVIRYNSGLTPKSNGTEISISKRHLSDYPMGHMLFNSNAYEFTEIGAKSEYVHLLI